MGYFVHFCGLFLEKSTYFQKQPITFLNKRTFSKNPVDVKKSRENCGQYTDNMLKTDLSYKKDPDTSGPCVDFYFSILILADAISDPRINRFPKE